jgi:MFS family permease
LRASGITTFASWQEGLAALAAGLGMFLAALDISVNVALPSIRSDFNTDLQTVQWVIVVFIATRAGLVMGAGSFADRFGLKLVYLF